MDVSLALTFVPAEPSNVTVAPGPKPEPSMLIQVPPAVFPEEGLNDVIAGRTYVKPTEAVCPSGFVTTSATVPAV